MCGSMVLLGTSAVLAFVWAARSGQFQNIRKGADVIFDESEPIGHPTDVIFQRKSRSRKSRSNQSPLGKSS
jgi:cbb3-type cytochrome oxidase maturation protein